jgi:hypothetical protein
MATAPKTPESGQNKSDGETKKRIPADKQVMPEGLLAVKAEGNQTMYMGLKQAGYVRSLNIYLEGDES